MHKFLVNKIFVAFTMVIVSGISVSAVASRQLPDFTELVEKTSPAVVKINTTTKQQAPRFQIPQGQNIPDIFRHFLDPRQMPERNMHSMGSGFFISEDGYVLTNHHVVSDVDEIVVRLTDRREYDAKLVGADPLSDLALLKIEEKGLPYLKLAEKDDLKVGEWVVAIGSPFGLDFSASAGIVSAKGRTIPAGEEGSSYVPFIQTDVAINPGNSGGPLFDMDGDVVGVNSQIYTQSGGSIGLSFAIPSTVAKNVVAQLKNKGKVDRGWLGVVIQEVDKDLANSFGLSKPQGALIAHMESDSPAAKSGLEVGDVILTFDGKEIEERSDLPQVVGVTKPGSHVKVEVMRKGKRKTLSVEVGNREGASLGIAQQPTESKQDVGGRLGVQVVDLEKSEREQLKLSGGVKVMQVAPSSPASDAGIRPGDVIAQIGFEDVEGAKQFAKLVKGLPTDTLLPIRFFRGAEPVFRTIKLAE